MNKAKSGGVSEAASQSARLLGNTVIGGLCGVGLVWTLTALWPPSRSIIAQFGYRFSSIAAAYPAVVLGLLVGMMSALLWQALRR